MPRRPAAITFRLTLLGLVLATGWAPPARAELDPEAAAALRRFDTPTPRGRALAAIMPVVLAYRGRLEAVLAEVTDPAFETMFDAEGLIDPARRESTLRLLGAKAAAAEGAMARIDAALAETRAALLTIGGSDPASEQYRVVQGALDGARGMRPLYATFISALAAWLQEGAEFLEFLGTAEAQPRLTPAGTFSFRSETGRAEFDRRADRVDALGAAYTRSVEALAARRIQALQQLERLTPG